MRKPRLSGHPSGCFGQRAWRTDLTAEADGPSDIPAFSLVHQNGGSTFAIYPKGDVAAMKQVEQMRADGRVDMYAEADYSENTTANMWITNRIQELADKIREREKNKIEKYAGGVPRHLV